LIEGAGQLLPFYLKLMYYTYILYSETLKKCYTGQTEDLNRRIEEHNTGMTAFMKRGIPWTIFYSQKFSTRSEALILEKKIKKRGAKRFLEDNVK
jgi:putative endonuclease